MKSLKALNKKEIKLFLERLSQQYGFSGSLDYVFLLNNKERLYIVNKDLSELDMSKLRVDSIGLYFAKYVDGVIRLTIEGSQLVGDQCSKNTVSIPDGLLQLWIRGYDIEYETDLLGFVIVKSGSDYFGCGKVGKEVIVNYYPKIRRVQSDDFIK